MAEIPFPEEFRIGNVFCMMVFGLSLEQFGVRLPHGRARSTRAGHRFDSVEDPAGPLRPSVAGRDVWGQRAGWERLCQHRAVWCRMTSTGKGTARWRLPIEDLVIYEMHVRGFTRHPSSGVKFPGTFAGPAREDSVPEGAGRQLRRADADLRVRRVREQPPASSRPAQRLLNYWGYSTSASSPRRPATPPPAEAGMQVRRAQDAGQGAAPQRHRGHPRRGLQPHRRGQRATGRPSPSAASTTRPTTC